MLRALQRRAGLYLYADDLGKAAGIELRAMLGEDSRLVPIEAKNDILF